MRHRGWVSDMLCPQKISRALAKSALSRSSTMIKTRFFVSRSISPMIKSNLSSSTNNQGSIFSRTNVRVELSVPILLSNFVTNRLSVPLISAFPLVSMVTSLIISFLNQSNISDTNFLLILILVSVADLKSSVANDRMTSTYFTSKRLMTFFTE